MIGWTRQPEFAIRMVSAFLLFVYLRGWQRRASGWRHCVNIAPGVRRDEAYLSFSRSRSNRDGCMAPRSRAFVFGWRGYSLGWRQVLVLRFSVVSGWWRGTGMAASGQDGAVPSCCLSGASVWWHCTGMAARWAGMKARVLRHGFHIAFSLFILLFRILGWRPCIWMAGPWAWMVAR